MNQMKSVEIQALLRLDFYAFAQKCFYEINPEEAFQPNWHLEVLTEKLAAVDRGKCRRLIVNLPPRGLKSLFVSVALPAFLLGRDPTLKILCVSYGQDLADKFSRDRRRIMASAWYQALFATRLSDDKNSVSEFETTAGGYCMATSVSGVTTGRGADVIIVDDPQKPAEALSDTQRKTANEWFGSTLRSRLNDKRTGRMILVMQRLHEDDLVGHVLEKEPWELVRFPAIAEQDEDYVIHPWYGTPLYPA